MSVARPVVNNASMMLTRRVRGRLFLLRPSKRVNQIVRYVVAVMATRHEIQLQAITALSNHWHLCVSDPHGKVVGFQRDCHSFIARALNASHGEFENVWCSSQTSQVVCVEPDDLVSKIAYTMANPVEAGLVRHGHSWPGVRHAWPCKPMKIARPTRFFRGENQGGEWPAVATLEFARPPGYEELSDDDLAGVVEAAIEGREDKLRKKQDAEKRLFLGRRAVLSQPRHARARGDETRFGISPQVACRNKWRRIERLQANKQWRLDYKLALEEWLGGNRDVVFPCGTYKIRIEHGATCARTPD